MSLKQLCERLLLYTQFYRQARTRYTVHSPFVYGIADQVLRGKLPFNDVEAYRNQLLRNHTPIKIQDFGAGYDGDGLSFRKKTIRQVVYSSGRRGKSGALLYHLVKYLQPNSALELGTNLGLSAVYQHRALQPQANFLTVEGSEALCDLAQQTFNALNCPIKVTQATFQAFLNNNTTYFDYVMVDGWHTYDGSLTLFRLLEPFLLPESTFVLDDIRWSKGMYRAFCELISHPRVTAAIELRDMGILCLDRDQAKQHFILKS